jgi:hypothetical protein
VKINEEHTMYKIKNEEKQLNNAIITSQLPYSNFCDYVYSFLIFAFDKFYDVYM